jgi:hypothetical protein
MQPDAFGQGDFPASGSFYTQATPEITSQIERLLAET